METKKEQREKLKITDTGLYLGWLESALNLVKQYGITKILIVTFLISLISTYFYIIFNPETAFDAYDRWRQITHTELFDLRMENAPKIQNLIDKLTFKVDASRTMVLELHNGSDGVGGLPFTKCSATYESLNIGAHPVASQYQNQNMSLIPFATFIFDKGYWYGNTDELLQIDRALYHKMKSNNTEHFAACVIEGIDKPLAILIVSFEKMPDEAHNCEEIRENIRHISMELSVFLEVEKMMKEKQK
jgi:hypothetical protein